MKKIISLFQRDHTTGLIRDEITPGAEWVVAGEGRATRKFDGTCCMFREGILYKRYEVKPGGIPPLGFEPASEVDPITGKQQGWVVVSDGPEDQWHMKAFNMALDRIDVGFPPDGTYELVGPKIQGNPERYKWHELIPHGAEELFDVPTDFYGLRCYLIANDIEGIVWHRPDGRMVKIKGKDFGIKRGKP